MATDFSAAFTKAFELTVGHEGGYSNNPHDKGGPTKFGITERVARENGYKGDMKDLPIELAQQVYRAFYWNPLQLDTVAAWDTAVAEKLFDTAVNMGVGIVARFFQSALNALNVDARGNPLYPDVALDGAIGGKVLACLNLLARPIDKAVMLKMLETQQGEKYLQIVQANASQKVFIRGWYDKRV